LYDNKDRLWLHWRWLCHHGLCISAAGDHRAGTNDPNGRCARHDARHRRIGRRAKTAVTFDAATLMIATRQPTAATREQLVAAITTPTAAITTRQIRTSAPAV